MGGFPNYSRAPRAVSVVDRSVRETAPGEYQAQVKLPKGGAYQAAFLLDEPRIVHCFDFSAEESAPVAGESEETNIDIEFLGEEREVAAGEAITVAFALTDRASGEREMMVEGAQLIVTAATGIWSEHYDAEPGGDGVLQATITLPRPGVYNVRVAVPSLNVAIGQLPALVLTAAPSGPAEGAARDAP